MHAYERSCRCYQYKCVSDAPYYVTIGDAGNAEGLATKWIVPQPKWSEYRMASYGHGELVVINSTHTLWQWHQNQDLSPTVADEFWITKGEATDREGVTAETLFSNTPRGVRGAKYNSNLISK